MLPDGLQQEDWEPAGDTEEKGRWERREGGGGRWGAAAWPQPPGSGCRCPQEAYESAVEYFGENPKTSPPTTFFPMFMRFIRAYKVGGDGGWPVPGGWGGSGVGGGLTPLWASWEKPDVRLGARMPAPPWARCCPLGRLQVLELGWGELGAVVGRRWGGCGPAAGPPWLSTSSPRLSQESRAGHRAVEETRGRSQRGRIWPPRQRGPARGEGVPRVSVLGGQLLMGSGGGKAKQVLERASWVGGEDGEAPSGCGGGPRRSLCAVPTRSRPPRGRGGSRWT